MNFKRWSNMCSKCKDDTKTFLKKKKCPKCGHKVYSSKIEKLYIPDEVMITFKSNIVNKKIKQKPSN